MCQPRTIEATTTEDLARLLRKAFVADGSWNAEALDTFAPQVWEAWIRARLRGADPYIPYGRDEFPEAADQLFVRLAREAAEFGIDLQSCKEGAASFLARLDPLNEASPHVLKGAMNILGRLRGREEPALAALRTWIRQETFLQREDWPLELHRTALYALASIQERGNPEDQELWKRWFSWENGSDEHKYAFTTAAFCGFVYSTVEVPGPQIRDLIGIYKQLKCQGKSLLIGQAILSLWVDREREEEQVRSELWREINKSDTPEADWEIVHKLGRRMGHCLLSLGAMKLLYPSQTVEAPRVRRNTWVAESWKHKPEPVPAMRGNAG